MNQKLARGIVFLMIVALTVGTVSIPARAAVVTEFVVSVELPGCGTMAERTYTSTDTFGVVKNDAVGYFSDGFNCTIPVNACLFDGAKMFGNAELLSAHFTAPATVTLQLKECISVSTAIDYTPPPLYKMWLLVKNDGSYCALISDTHPSVEAQKAFCFPKKTNRSWVANKMLCKGYVYEGQPWSCWADLRDWLIARAERQQAE